MGTCTKTDEKREVICIFIANNERICITKGDDAVLTVDVSGYELQSGDRIRLTVRADSSDSGAPLLAVEGDGNLLRFRHDDTARLPVGEYSADIQLQTAVGARHTLWPALPESRRGREHNFRNFTVMPEVTKE